MCRQRPGWSDTAAWELAVAEGRQDLQRPEEAKKHLSPRVPEGRGPTCTLVSDTWPPGPGNNEFLLFGTPPGVVLCDGFPRTLTQRGPAHAASRGYSVVRVGSFSLCTRSEEVPRSSVQTGALWPVWDPGSGVHGSLQSWFQ